MDNFVNLHVHTEASLQDSVITIPKLYQQVKQYGQSATAITDHGSCASFVDFNNYFKQKGDIKPIFGMEAYCTNQKIFDGNKRRQDHLVLLAMTDEGLVNIRRLQRLAVDDFYYKPMLHYDTVLEKQHREGIFALSACSLSTISKAILDNNMQEAYQYAEYFYDLFDGNFALELQFHPDYQDQWKINKGILEISDKLDYPVVVTCDSHFCNEQDKSLRKIIKAIGWHKKIDDPALHSTLKSNCIGNSDLIRQFARETDFGHDDVVDLAIQNASYIGKICNAELEEPARRIPVFDKYDEFIQLFDEVDWS